MRTLEVSKREAGTTAVPLESIERLAEGMRGTVLLPNSEGYDDARQIWNGMIDRRPALIARCAGTADVLDAVNFARDHDLLVAIRGGGHNVAGNAVCEGGLMIDLSGMRGVHVDPQQRRAWSAGGATWGDFDAETQLHGLATTGGLISDTGVAGLTLGGGIGWLSPSYGLACDNLVSAEVVTADGRSVRVSQNENADLLWGLKGGGGNFGVVTSFEFSLHPVGPVLFGGMAIYPLAYAGEILPRFKHYMDESPDEVAGLAGLTSTPDGNRVIAIIGVYNGPVETGERALAPLRSFAAPIMDSFAPTPYRKIQTLFDAGTPKGLRYYWKSSFLDCLPEEALAIVIEQARARPSPLSKIFLEFMGGGFSRVPRDAAVFDHRASPYNLLIIGSWQHSADDGENRSWTRETWQRMNPYSSGGVYVNYLGTESDEGSNRVPAAYGPGKLEKLVALKQKYDPMNLFRMNQNISPG